MAVLSGYAKTCEAAVMFNECDVGKEYFAFERRSDAEAFADAIVDSGYGSVYGTRASELFVDIDLSTHEQFKGAITHKTAQEYLKKGVDVDTMFKFDEIVINGDDEEEYCDECEEYVCECD